MTGIRMASVGLLVALAASLCCPVQPAQILAAFQFPGKSHLLMFEPLLRELAARGHQLTVVSHFPQTQPLANYTDVSVAGSTPPMSDLFTWELLESTNLFKMAHFMWTSDVESCRVVLEHEAMQTLLRSGRTFDLVIAEAFGADCMAGLAHHFSAPLVLLTSSVALPWTATLLGNPANPAYVPDYFLAVTDRMSLWQRTTNTLLGAVLRLGYRYWSLGPTNDIARRHFGDDMPPLEQLVNNASLYLLNSHYSISRPRPLVPAVVEVGGLHVRPGGRLPEDVGRFLDGATHGAVYFSLGSLVQLHTFPPTVLHAILTTFSRLPQRVLVRGDPTKLPQLPSNVMAASWVSQMTVLAHPRVMLFVSHGGMLGLQEAVATARPVLGIPQFADQVHNLAILEAEGAATVLPLADLSEASFSAALRHLLTDGRFSVNAHRVSRIFHDRPQRPLDAAVFWTEYVARHHGAPHLRCAAADLSWAQLLLLDLVGALVVALVVGLLVARALLRTR